MKSRLCFPSILTRVVVFTFPWLLAGAVAAGHAQTIAIDGNFSEWSSAEIVGCGTGANDFSRTPLGKVTIDGDGLGVPSGHGTRQQPRESEYNNPSKNRRKTKPRFHKTSPLARQ